MISCLDQPSVDCLRIVDGKEHFPAHDSKPNQERSYNSKEELEEVGIPKMDPSIGWLYNSLMGTLLNMKRVANQKGHLYTGVNQHYLEKTGTDGYPTYSEEDHSVFLLS